jgi:hypothetical protein
LVLELEMSQHMELPILYVRDAEVRREMRAFSASRPTLYFEVSLRAEMFVTSVKLPESRVV